MRRFLLISFIFFCVQANHAQTKLYYFLTADRTKVGVKDEFGKVIIPAEFPNYGFYEGPELITSRTIEFYVDKDRELTYDKLNPAMPMGAVYNRQGQFLYNPQFFDNGPDYWEEGIRRYVENDKMGFVNKKGEKITLATYGFLYSFNYGYAKAFKGNMQKKYEKGGEHWYVVAADSNVTSCLINTKGEVVHPLEKKQSDKDYYYEGKYYPYPFVYSDEEQQILNRLNRDIVGISMMYQMSYYQYKYKPLQLEITERPDEFDPYFVIKAYDEQEGVGIRENLFVDAKTKEPFVIDYEGSDVPLRQAIIKSLEEFLNFKDRDILPETRIIAEQELKRLKSHP